MRNIHGPSSVRVIILLLAACIPEICHAFTAITLTSQDFESKTQAATGQTTGIWYTMQLPSLTVSEH